ncbi:MAG TPA: ABC transporter substrate-binding protein [Thermoplasmata archaeon]|jgi:ABC-type branched-subunit amino acid transport system substrate-binding protein
MEEQKAPAAEAPKPAPKGRGLWIGIAVVVVVIVVLLAAFYAGLFNPPPTKVTVLKIGTVLSITGGLAAFGGDNQNGTDMAVEEINAAGGVLGNPIQIFHQDDGTTPATAASVARTLISTNQVAAIVGATGSGQCSTIVPVAANNSVVEISASCTSPKFSNQSITGGWFARTAPSDALQGVVAASYAYDNLSFTHAAVLGINNDYGVGLATVFANSFANAGGTITQGSPRIVPATTSTSVPDYTTDLQAVLNVDPAPEVVYVVAYPPDGVQMMKNFDAALGANPAWASIQWVFSEGLYDSAFINPLVAAGVDVSAYEGTAPSAYGGLNGPQFNSWAGNYSDRFGRQPTLFTGNAYDAVYLIALAAQKAGDASGLSIKANLPAVSNSPGTKIYPGGWAEALTALGAGQDVDYEGASGSVNIDQYGDPFSGYIVWNVTTSNSLDIRAIFPESLVTTLVGQIGTSSIEMSVQSLPPMSHAPTWTGLLQAAVVVSRN